MGTNAIHANKSNQNVDVSNYHFAYCERRMHDYTFIAEDQKS